MLFILYSEDYFTSCFFKDSKVFNKFGSDNMIVFMVAGIYNDSTGKYSEDTLSGYRLFIFEKNKTVDASIADTIKFLSNRGIDTKNLKVSGGRIRYTNGNICRYAKINSKGELLTNTRPIILLQKIGNKGYQVCDYLGRVLNLENSKIIDYAEKYGIANGKIVNDNGNKYISSIRGNYIEMDVESELKHRSNEANQDNSKIQKTGNITAGDKVIFKEFKDANNSLSPFEKYVVMIIDSIDISHGYPDCTQLLAEIKDEFKSNGVTDELLVKLRKLLELLEEHNIMLSSIIAKFSVYDYIASKLSITNTLLEKFKSVDKSETTTNNTLIKLGKLIAWLSIVRNAALFSFYHTGKGKLLELYTDNKDSLDDCEKLIIGLAVDEDKGAEIINTISYNSIIEMMVQERDIKEAITGLINKAYEKRIINGLEIRKNDTDGNKFRINTDNYSDDVISKASELIELLKLRPACKAKSESKIDEFNKVLNDSDTLTTICDTIILNEANCDISLIRKMESSYDIIKKNMREK